AGTNYLIVVSDVWNYLDEVDESNNTGTEAIDMTVPPVPDLEVSDVTVPADALNGGSVRVTWMVSNTGEVATTRAWYDRVLLVNDVTGAEIVLSDYYYNGGLDAGGSTTRSQDVFLPIDVVGTYRVAVITDVYDYIAELDGEFNNRTESSTLLTVSNPPLPDLIGDHETVSEADFGEVITIEWTGENVGDLTLGSYWYDSVYLSRDTQYNSGDILLGDRYVSPTPFDPGETYAQSMDVTLPLRDDFGTGEYFILVVRDAYNYRRETVENNNTSATAITVTARPTADLTVGDITAPETAESGTEVIVEWTITNNGSAAASNWVDYLYLSRANSTTNDAYIGELRYTGTLDAGESITRTMTVTLPVDRPGNRRITVTTDAWGEIYERNGEQNNSRADDRAIVIGLPPLPDLVVTDIEAPAEGFTGRPVEFTYTVTNQGDAATTGGWRDYFYLSNADGTSTSRYLGTLASTTALGVGESLERTVVVTLPVGQLGNRRIIVVTEADGQYYEGPTGENNNQQADDVPMVVSDPILPDLRIDSIDVDDGAFGSPITIEWTGRNAGVQATDGGNWYDRVWLSRDATMGGDDIYLGDFTYSAGALAIDGTYTGTLTTTLPLNQTFGTGTYYVLVRSDNGSQQREFDETNNVGSQSLDVTMPPTPDLVVSDITAPLNAFTGGEVEIRWTITNQGAAAVTGWTDALYLSTAGGSDLDRYLGRFSYDGELAVGESLERVVRVNLPIDVAGQRRFIVNTDDTNQHFEFGGEANNRTVDDVPTTLVVPPLADLVVSSITAPLDALSGQSVPITWTLTNQGTADIEGSWVDQIYLSGDAQIGADTFFGSFTFEGRLAAGESVTRTQAIDLPLAMSGNRWVVIRTDANNTIGEYQGENNNVSVDDRAMRIVQAPLANLQVTEVTPPTEPFSGQPTLVEWVVTTPGTGATSAPVWYDQVWLSLDDVLDDADVYLGQVANPSFLDAGEAYASQLTVTLPDGLDGNFRFLVRTDYYDAVEEGALENDNITSSDLTRVRLTPPPDLQVESVNAPPQAFSGQPVNLTWTIVNAGDGRTAATAWTDRAFLSTDEVLDASDVQLGQFHRAGALDAGDTYTGNLTAQLPVGISGPYYVLVRTDVANTVYEHVYEGNNVGFDATPINVLLTPPPDLEVDSIATAVDVIAGTTLGIDYRVVNYGATATPNAVWTDGFYLSTDSVLDAGDRLIGSFRHGGALPVDGFYDRHVDLTVPFDLEGAFYLLIHTDSGNEVFELDNDNNVVASTQTVAVLQRPADLVVDRFEAPATGAAGREVVLSWDVRNAGTGTTVSTRWVDRIYASVDGVLGNGDDVLLGEFVRGAALVAGATYTRNETVSLPLGLSGTYRLFAVTDAGGSVVEGVENNNTRGGVEMTITRDTADLQVVSLTAPPQAEAGETLAVQWRVENLGGNRTNASYWYDEVWLSRDQILDVGTDVRLGEVRRTNALGAGDGYDAIGNFALSAGLAAGEWDVVVRADR
ncbi:MAG: hypothetical protein KIT73_14215, partial [Burkholderiales bacterium]|nr:hypothetical protein [Burkholderiales bacterium]